MYSISKLNDNDKKNIKAFGYNLFVKYKDEANNIPADKEEIVKKLLDNYGITCVHACQDKIADTFYFEGNTEKELRNPDVARQLILNYIETHEIATKYLPENESALSDEENKKLAEKLQYMRYANYKKFEVEQFANLESENFISVVKAFMNGYTMEDVKEMVETGKFVKFDNEVNASLENLVDEYGMQVNEDAGINDIEDEIGDIDFDEFGI